MTGLFKKCFWFYTNLLHKVGNRVSDLNGFLHRWHIRDSTRDLWPVSTKLTESLNSKKSLKQLADIPDLGMTMFVKSGWMTVLSITFNAGQPQPWLVALCAQRRLTGLVKFLPDGSETDGRFSRWISEFSDLKFQKSSCLARLKINNCGK